MHILEHLFLVGEFPERAHLLSGLTLEQVTLCPELRVGVGWLLNSFISIIILEV